MSKHIRGTIAAFGLALALTTPAGATSFSTNQSDLWWNPAESGWGIQFVQQADVIFATMFVYDQNTNPTWYTATLNFTGGSTWSGTLMATKGPWFGNPTFNPAQVTQQQVGAMTVNFSAIETALLNYAVNGVIVNKTITRQLLRLEDFSGSFAGAVEAVASGCASPGDNGAYEDIGYFRITQSGSTFTLTFSDLIGSACNYTGTYQQAGHMGSASGTFVCLNPSSHGTFSASEMEVSQSGFTAKFTQAAVSSCQTTGRFGGLRRSPT